MAPNRFSTSRTTSWFAARRPAPNSLASRCRPVPGDRAGARVWSGRRRTSIGVFCFYALHAMPLCAEVLTLYAVMSVVAVAMYWSDKRRAHRGQWRFPEATLHTVELFGGWPGAWMAQHVLRHKSSK